VCSVDMAIALATEAPRHAIGLTGIGPGQSARQLLRWHLESDEQTLSWQRLGPRAGALALPERQPA
jgi:N-acetylglucosamine-6-phosphate deacetylase